MNHLLPIELGDVEWEHLCRRLSSLIKVMNKRIIDDTAHDNAHHEAVAGFGPAKNQKIHPITGRIKMNMTQNTIFPVVAPLLKTLTMAQMSATSTIKASSPLTSIPI
jgi:hypothetical protein